MAFLRTFIPWFLILATFIGCIWASSSLAAVLASVAHKLPTQDTEVPDITRPASISIQNMPLVTKDPEQLSWFAESTRDESKDAQFRRDMVRF